MAKKIISKLVCSAMAAMTIASLGMMSAGAAGNYTDRPYTAQFDAPRGISHYYTQTREKQDYTSSYVSVTGGMSVVACVYGANADLGESTTAYGRTPCYRYNNHDYVEYVYTGQNKKLINVVKESGFSKASIHLQPLNPTGYAKGMWSPDSI